MMSEILQLESSPEVANLQNNHTHVQLKEKPSIPVVTTAEASSQEMVISDSPKQPQAGHMTAAAPLSTVHVQLPISASHGRTSFPVLTHSLSESVLTNHNPCKLLTRSKTVRSPPPTDEGTDPQITLTKTVNTSFDSCDSGIASELPPRLEAFRQSKTLSRDSSFEYTDSTGTDLHEFIVKTLRNPRDRKMLIRLERDFLEFTQDPGRLYLQYPPMTSYHRMIVHRVAAYFGMDHNVDQSGTSVIINKTPNTRIPELRFVELVSREESEDSDSAPRSILRRQNTPSDDSTPPKIDSPIAMYTMEDKRSKSIEEREEEYNKARHRIFNQDSLSSQSSQSSLELQFQQALLREDEEVKPIDLTNERKVLAKAQSFDERNLEKSSTASSDVKPPTTKVLTRSNSSPGISRERLFQQSLGMRSSPKGSKHHVSGSSVAYVNLDMAGCYQLQGGEVMVPVQGYPGVMAVPAAGNLQGSGQATQAGMMLPIPQEGMQQGIMLYNPTTGGTVVGPDGNPVLVQQPYQPVIVKQGPGGTSGAHAQTQETQSQQPIQQASGQVVPQYTAGISQPMYVVQQQPRMQYAQQPSSEGVQAVTWSSLPAGYSEMTSQFGAMSMGGQHSEMEPSRSTGQLAAGDASVSVPATVAGPVYVTSMTQAGVVNHPGHVQYVVMPPGQLRQVTEQNSAHAAQSSQAPLAAYIVASHPTYQPHGPVQQYQMTGDGSVIQQPRSQTPPTPPRTSSPVYTSHFSQPQYIVGSSSHSQQLGSTHVPHPHGAHLHQHTPPQTTTQVIRHTVPFIVPGGRAVPVMHNTSGGSATQPQGNPQPVHYVNPVQVQGQYPGGQKRPFNIDRRQTKSSDMYSAEIPVVLPGQTVPPGTAIQVAVPYGDALDRSQYGQYIPYQRFPLPGQMVSGAGGKSKHKHQQHRRGSSPRSQIHHGQASTPQGTQPQGQGQRDQTKSPRQGSRTSTPEAERTAGQQHTLEIYGVPKEIDKEELVQEMKRKGAEVKFRKDYSSSQENVSGIAIFPSAQAARQAYESISSPNFKLRYIQNHKSLSSKE